MQEQVHNKVRGEGRRVDAVRTYANMEWGRRRAAELHLGRQREGGRLS